ncbi:biotin carboxylase N-terminal domain-containing protein [Ferrimonas sp. YFM]|uniref:acetyl/propionyl/methylcrotonyl-CoA carboxylase subunit alpha n=1 Tax=Ferrimonas sp. YFM TaxID=3028878 RepID=UPI0025729AEC|nr:biotin carboxylase N-terminal domain-containing protein [Ferrimonas sp. YFM]BDY04909.1 acetyl/propionyl-CoA carboxylase subunit alpha [Ferrimonas sp. YFM]
MGFHTLLVANRGEIAARILSSARSLGYRTVAVYSEADADSPVLDLADEAYCLGEDPAADSYLNVDAIIRAAHSTGADAIHPGYGFLSEQGEFARRCRQEGITFIGPSAEVIDLMGDKARAKAAAKEAGVPCIPGYQGQDQSVTRLTDEALSIGLPVMIKAAAGGGGKGMRLARTEAELPGLIELARSESAKAFGSEQLILEAALTGARHIEVQVFSDSHGQHIFLGERDCSLQRRHQKVIEEAPAPGLSQALRQRMGQAAVALARHCGYQGAGTVEFLLAEDGTFYFLEMNTRLQVEHPVTEMITGQDLVAWQIAVAAGAPLPLTQEQVTLSGCAVEARLYAEDPSQSFLPATGTIEHWQPPQGDGIRVDHALAEGISVSRHYDPMLAKLIAWGPDRPTALRRLKRALEQTRLMGITTNQGYLTRLLAEPVIQSGEADTTWLDRHPHPCAIPAPPPWLWALASVVLCGNSPACRPLSLRLDYGKESNSLSLRPEGQGTRVQLSEEDYAVRVEHGHPHTLICQIDEHRRTLAFSRHTHGVTLGWRGQNYRFHDQTLAAPDNANESHDGQVRALMDGCIQSVLVKQGDRVEAEQPLLTLEAMKMELPLTAGRAGRVTQLTVETGDQVKTNQLLITIED